MITYQKGNLFEHIQHNDIIAHCCNNMGAFGAGFSAHFLTYFPEVAESYKNWAKDIDHLPNPHRPPFRLGETMMVMCKWKPDPATTIRRTNLCYVANMIGQHGTRSKSNPKPIRYDALKSAMQAAVDWFVDFLDKPVSRIVAPKFGAGLAGGDWEIIEDIINDVWKDENVVIFTL